MFSIKEFIGLSKSALKSYFKMASEHFFSHLCSYAAVFFSAYPVPTIFGHFVSLFTGYFIAHFYFVVKAKYPD